MENGISAGLPMQQTQRLYTAKTVSDIVNEASERKNEDSFEKSVDNYIAENRRRQKREQELAAKQSRDMAIARRRKLKLLLKKHEDYLRFLEGTALKRSAAERERIKNPNVSQAEIDAAASLPPDAKAPMFIRVR